MSDTSRTHQPSTVDRGLLNVRRRRFLNAGGVGPMLIGRDDVHIVRDGKGPASSPQVAIVISTRVRPGREAD